MKSMRTLYEERIEKRRRDSHSYSIGSISPESSSRLQIWRDDWAQSDEVFDAKVQSGQLNSLAPPLKSFGQHIPYKL